MGKLNTSEKILEAAMSLFSQQGYRTVTIKKIAKEAGHSEMTVFRHFHNKQNLFERAYDRYVFSPRLKTLFDSGLEWDLEKDLMKISDAYQETLVKNVRTILMEFKNDDLTIDLNSPIKKFPNELKKLMVDYFSRMNERRVIEKNPEALAINFLASNFGIFISFIILENFNTNVDIDTCITDFVKTFARGITP